MGPHWSPVHARTPTDSESSPIRPNFKLWEWKSNVNTHSAQAKPLYKIKKSLFGGPSSLNCPFWSPAVPNDMDSGKDVWGVYWPNFGVRGQGGGKHMNRVQFLDFFDFIAAAFKGTTLKKQQKNNVLFFLGRAPKRYLKPSSLELVWNHLYLSICLFLFLSLALSIISIYRLYSHYL